MSGDEKTGGGRAGAVVIGRNEGERLRVCLESLARQPGPVVYVDSASRDGSVQLARALGAIVVELDMSIPFTAARARNEGFRRLLDAQPDLEYVQFVDGDCEVVDGWMDKAIAFLDGEPRTAAACGRRRERFPERSIYNMLCDFEWNTPIGEARSCGGDVMLRAQALAEVGGYRDDLIAGEEPELCVRLRSRGWRIWRLDAEMTMHDAALTRFGQWWKRSLRGGHAFAEGASLHGKPPERHCLRESRRAWLWGVWLPLIILAASLVDWRFAALGLAYPAQVLRIALRGDVSSRANWLRSLFLVLARFPEGVGQIKFQLLRGLGRRAALIEYK
jgi:glycosyltransferase involved in cell wall biosynthesis